jgi:DNA-binding XRE family transcriptional regulator
MPAHRKRRDSASTSDTKVSRPLSPSGRGSQPARDDEGKLQEVFSRNAKMARGVLGITQEEIADRADLHRSYITQYEGNTRNLTLRSVERIAHALRLDVRVLFDPKLTERKLSRLIQTQSNPKAAKRS